MSIVLHSSSFVTYSVTDNDLELEELHRTYVLGSRKLSSGNSPPHPGKPFNGEPEALSVPRSFVYHCGALIPE